jgi:hypothetical protein
MFTVIFSFEAVRSSSWQIFSINNDQLAIDNFAFEFGFEFELEDG